MNDVKRKASSSPETIPFRPEDSPDRNDDIDQQDYDPIDVVKTGQVTKPRSYTDAPLPPLPSERKVPVSNTRSLPPVPAPRPSIKPSPPVKAKPTPPRKSSQTTPPNGFIKDRAQSLNIDVQRLKGRKLTPDEKKRYEVLDDDIDTKRGKIVEPTSMFIFI